MMVYILVGSNGEILKVFKLAERAREYFRKLQILASERYKADLRVVSAELTE